MDPLNTRFHNEVFTPYMELLKTGYRFHPDFKHARQLWESKLDQKELVNGPYLEKSQVYAAGEPLDQMPLHAKTVETIRNRLKGRSLYQHQTDALKLILNGRNTIIATGTSSGKTLCYQIPILDDLVRDAAAGLRAIIIYPLNALVNDQLVEWGEMLNAHPDITYARFTGQTPKHLEMYEERLKKEFETWLEEMIPSDTKSGRERKVNLLWSYRLRRASSKELLAALGESEYQKLKLSDFRQDPENQLVHRDAIHSKPPHILITNFSMLEYLLERPVDAPIFDGARLKFLVLDEAHAYRGVQATEIAFLIRRLKDRLGIERLTCIGTSATLGDPNEPQSAEKVRRFASSIFGESFTEPNPIRGAAAEPKLAQPSFAATPAQYQKAAEVLRENPKAAVAGILGAAMPAMSLANLLDQDENLYRLRKRILDKNPIRLVEAAEKLWQNTPGAEKGLQALMEVVAASGQEGQLDAFLPTRLHYFVRAQAGLHVCFHLDCPGRTPTGPAFFVSRTNADNSKGEISTNSVLGECREGFCPDCWTAGHRSQLVEVVSCRKCGYLYGALQDLGPRRAQKPDKNPDEPEPYYDSFSTELGWAADSFWSYFSVDGDLPFPRRASEEEDAEESGKLLDVPAELDWCVCCGKKRQNNRGDNCACDKPHTRRLRIFHRQCENTDRENLYAQKKKPLTSCPNCGARNASGLEPVQRFQESEDETGLAMAIPLAHFQVTPAREGADPPRKLLCFTDHRQRAAAFPSLLEEETFAHDLGRKIVQFVNATQPSPIKLVELGQKLHEATKPDLLGQPNPLYDSSLFLPVSRLPDDLPSDPRERNTIQENLWIGEVISYFGIPDSARESAEDFGLVAVEYQAKEGELDQFSKLFAAHGLRRPDTDAVFQVLVGFVRQAKAFTLPKGVAPDDPAFGRIYQVKSYALKSAGPNVKGWLPKVNKDGSFRDNFITSYLRRVTGLEEKALLDLAESIWNFLTSGFLLTPLRSEGWQLDHERIAIIRTANRYVCSSCGSVTTYCARGCCPRKDCKHKLVEAPFEPDNANLIGQWLAGAGVHRFTSLKSEEHTAQINKDVAKRIEDDFRTEGVNLLSSTTTFEMGINIGDLQKVMLRNAPPSSASYVQRAGRAGRGKDKNSVCVTICRRTKYDADAWAEPARLMQGTIRPPAVFIGNPLIAQRHFNAVLFAKFLRQKVRDECLLGKLEQTVPVEPFLSTDIRVKLEALLEFPLQTSLVFPAWAATQSYAEMFRTEACRDLLSAVSDYLSGRSKCVDRYEKIMGDLGAEVEALLEESNRLAKLRQFDAASNLDRAIKNLFKANVIDVLAKRGFLPRYAFPLDVVTLETELTRWSGDSDVELSRDRGIAISEFAPGAQVVARKKIFTSEGLYLLGDEDRPEPRWYARCQSCEQVRTALTKEPLETPCPICGEPQARLVIARFVEPEAFSIRVDKKKRPHFRRAMLLRQRQPLTHFTDRVEETEFAPRGRFRVALKENGSLFRYNLGPGNRGFVLCPACGASAPKSEFPQGEKHKRLRPAGREWNCDCRLWGTGQYGLAYGHQFHSFCLIVRPVTNAESVESLSYALQKGLCRVLDLEASDVGVSRRWLNKRGALDSGVEIILYDRTPGGAGFVKEGMARWEEVEKAALDLCADCTCEKACYDCLKDFGNQGYHEQMDRQTVVEFFKP